MFEFAVLHLKNMVQDVLALFPMSFYEPFYEGNVKSRNGMEPMSTHPNWFRSVLAFSIAIL